MNTEPKEISAFRIFRDIHLEHCEHFEKRCPPEPDILAVVAGKRISYEMTEAIDPASARKHSDTDKTTKEVTRSFESLPPTKKRLLEANHNGKMINLCFRDGVSLRGRKQLLAEIFDYVISIPPDFGSRELEGKRQPFNMLDSIMMKQIGYMGIRWECSGTISWIDPEEDLRKRIVDKMEHKHYQTRHPIELIVYLDRQADPPPNTGWQDRLSEVASKRLADSPFRAVWLLNSRSNSVCILAGSG